MKRKHKSFIIFSSFKAWMRHRQIGWKRQYTKKTVDTAKLKKISNNH